MVSFQSFVVPIMLDNNKGKEISLEKAKKKSCVKKYIQVPRLAHICKQETVKLSNTEAVYPKKVTRHQSPSLFKRSF